MTDRDKAAFLYGISFTVEKLKATGADAESCDSLFAEANRALNYGPTLLDVEMLAEIEKALESGGFSWPPQGGEVYLAARHVSLHRAVRQDHSKFHSFNRIGSDILGG